jgi:coenzyme F420 hydrogenase subunit beta
MAAGYFELVRSQSSEVIRAQPLAQRRAVVFGRLMAMKALLIPVPKFIDFSLHKAWMANPLSIRIRTILGTSKRLLTRGLWHRKQLFKSNKTTRSQNNS